MTTETQTTATHAVLYTDGGCRPTSRGMGGWGVHGYFFIEEEAKQGTGCPKALPTAEGYVPGSGKPKITVLQYVDGFGNMPDSTNNQAELMAAIKALRLVEEHKIQNVLLKIDSKYTLDGMGQWMHGWAKNNWTRNGGEAIPNVELWKQLHELYTGLQAQDVKIGLKWVKGHSGAFGNDLADAHTQRATITGLNGTNVNFLFVSDAKGYWNNKVERNRMFSQPQWYFTTFDGQNGMSDCGRHVYYLGTPREDDDLLGKPIADATFSILYLKEQEPILASVRKSIEAMGDGRMQGLVRAHLSEIFNPSVYEELGQYGESLLVRDMDKQRLFTWNERLLAEEIRPVRLAYHAVSALQCLERMLQAYLDPSKAKMVRQTDLTGLLYECDAGGKKKPVYKLKPHVNSSMRSLDVEACYVSADQSDKTTKIALAIGQDTPDRNTLAALAGEATKVTLLTWPEGPNAIRHATVIEADGDVGIWSGIYSNLHLLTS